MTTIVVDRELKIMAADTLMNEDGFPVEVEKIRRFQDRLVGGCGYLDQMQKYWDRVEDGKKRPKLKDSIMLELLEDGRLFVYDSNGRITIKDRFYTAGSGKQAAMAALRDGKSPEDAIRAAMTVDIYTGIGVQVEAI